LFSAGSRKKNPILHENKKGTTKFPSNLQKQYKRKNNKTIKQRPHHRNVTEESNLKQESKEAL
jgi:hypothetical protein